MEWGGIALPLSAVWHAMPLAIWELRVGFISDFNSFHLVLRGKMTDRSNCWSITIFDESYSTAKLPAGWEIKGQKEMCPKTNKEHYQGMLTTPQVRFTAVKKVFPLAHIEKARKPTALAQYVKKEDTRLCSIPDRKSQIPTLWDYSEKIAHIWNDESFTSYCSDFEEHASLADKTKTDIDDLALRYVDSLISDEIRNGSFGIEFIAINPMFRSAWKKFWRPMVARARKQAEEDSNTIVYPDAILQETILEETSEEKGCESS